MSGRLALLGKDCVYFYPRRKQDYCSLAARREKPPLLPASRRPHIEGQR